MAKSIEDKLITAETNTIKKCIICVEDFEANQDVNLCDDCNKRLEERLKSSSDLTGAEVIDELNKLLPSLDSNNSNRRRITTQTEEPLEDECKRM
jgi:hypothetical protein